jgi:hypothetical protein
LETVEETEETLEDTEETLEGTEEIMEILEEDMKTEEEEVIEDIIQEMRMMNTRWRRSLKYQGVVQEGEEKR